jgi:hypothetical protein
VKTGEDDDICGLCGLPEAHKKPHECYWPTERRPNTCVVHNECECEECERAFMELSEEEKSKLLSGM